jgi:Meiotically up-regulated gene 113
MPIRYLLQQEVSEMATVYFLRNGNDDLFKIGITRGEVEARRKALSTGNPSGLVEFARIETPNASATETFAHNWIESRRCSGDAKEFYALTEDEAATHVALTTEFATTTLPIREKVAEVTKLSSSDRVLVPGEREVAICQELAEVDEQIYRLSMRKEMLESRLKLGMGDAREIAGHVTWKTEVRHRLDNAAVKERHFDIYTECQVESRCRPFKVL